MTKHLRRWLLILTTILLPATSFAYDVEIDGIYYDLSSNGKIASVVSGDKYKYIGDVSIPASITYRKTNYSVKSIDDYAFYRCPGLTGITIPSSVTSIGNYAFYECPGLTSITIPSSVTSIGNGAFSDTGLTSITIPSSVTSIGNGAFSDTGLTSITIPSSVTSIGSSAFRGCGALTSITIPSSVTSIGSSAFRGCGALTSIFIPSSVTSIGNYAFSDTGLTSINVDSNNATFLSKEGVLFNKEQTKLICCPSKKSGEYVIPSSVTSIGNSAFGYCTGLTSITIPSSVTSIEDGAFQKCEGITCIIIPSSVTQLGGHAFFDCTGLTNITIPSSITKIESETFHDCTGLTNITIPSSVTSIGDFAFSGCRGLTSLIIPSSVTSIGASAFKNCLLKPLLLFGGKPTGTYHGTYCDLNSSSVICAKASEMLSIATVWSGELYDIDKPYACKIAETYLCGISFSITPHEWVSCGSTLQSVKLNNIECLPDENGLYTVTGLDINKKYRIEVNYKAADGETRTFAEYASTANPTITRNSWTQTTMTLSVSASSDETCTASAMGVSIDNKTYTCINGRTVINGLVPGRTYTVTPFVDYGTTRVTGNSVQLSTASLRPTITIQEAGPTSFILKGSYTTEDASVSETGFENYGNGSTLEQKGLKPNTTYTISYYVKTKEGSNESVSKEVTTPALELTTLTPRCVSNSCAIVAAETNISEEETGVGFQWKKYDAPSSLAPSEGYAAIYGGQLEGYIKNLQSTSYYNVRAFYKSSDGTYYYGDWVTFDPSDFSYFEPTVHTYAATEVTHSTARVKGYVLAGTENIDEQGFEYWTTGEIPSKARIVYAAPAIGTDDVFVVFATGQVMSAELSDLQPGTTYYCRAFVKTSAGVSYGEEQTFTTESAPTGIGRVETEVAAPTIVGYYDLSGRKWETPKRGVNIVRYSDGTTRKVLVK